MSQRATDTKQQDQAQANVQKRPEQAAAAGIAGLQQSAGNAAVAQMVQRQPATAAKKETETKKEASKGTGPVTESQLVEFAKGVEGAKYVWGGTHWGDCSGAVASLANYATGRPPWVRMFYTGSQGPALAKMGFKSGLGPAGSLNIGWYHSGGAGHTAATLPNGVNFEMGGRRGNGQYNGPQGATGGRMNQHAHLPPSHFGSGGGGKEPTPEKGSGEKENAGQEKGGGFTYKIKWGDTLSGIAQRYLGSAGRYPELARLNNIPNPNLIYAGASLQIPGTSNVATKTGGQTGGKVDSISQDTNGDKKQPEKDNKDKTKKGGLVTVDQLVQAMPGLSKGKADGLIGHLNNALVEGDITTPKRIAAFIAQVGHESASLLYFEEIASGAAYEGRRDLGNTQPGDGKRFKGRGPIQLTGRSNYTRAGQALGLDLVGNPEQVATYAVGFRTTVWFWSTNKLNNYADSGDFKQLTRRINGGYNGLADREARWAKAKRVFGA